MKKQYTPWIIIGAYVFLFALAGCSAEKQDNKVAPMEKPAAQAEPGPATFAADQIDGTNIMLVSASHVFVTHNEAQRKPAEVNRTKEEALAKINEALKKIKDGVDFADVAVEYTDCPSKIVGGNLGVFDVNRNSPAFTKVLLSLKMDEVSGVVETDFGYHIIKRQDPDNPGITYHARHILVSYDDATNKPFGQWKRTKEEALERIKEVQKKLQAKDADFAALVVEYSDGLTKGFGGDLGNEVLWGAMFPAFEQAVYNLKEHGISDIVESPAGFHIIQRLPQSKEKAHVRHIQVMHEKSHLSREVVKRTKEEAQKLAEELFKKIKKNDANFAALAKEYSGCASRYRGGDLGIVGITELIPLLEKAAFNLEIGEIVIVETKVGYHVVQRLPLDAPIPPLEAPEKAPDTPKSS